MKWAVALPGTATGRRLATGQDDDGGVNAVAFTPAGAGRGSSGGSTVRLRAITAEEP